jgi:hypothetical protein
MCGVSNAWASAEYEDAFYSFDCYYYECSETMECEWNMWTDELDIYYSCTNGDCNFDCNYGFGRIYDINCSEYDDEYYY